MKKLLLLALLFSSNAFANTAISQLPLASAASVNANDSFPYVDSIADATKRLIIDDLVNLTAMSSRYAPKASPVFTGTVTAPVFIGGLQGLASTATALAANGSNCSAGTFPLGVDASGNSEGCQALPTNIVGTANQIAVSGSTGVVTISIPTNPVLPGNTTGTFIGNLTGNASGSASSFTGSLAGDVTGTQGITAIANLARSKIAADTVYAVVLDDSTGRLVSLANGSTGKVLTSQGTSAIPTWQTPSGSVGTITWVTKTADYTLSSGDSGILVNGSSSVNLTLPTASTVSGHIYYIKNIGSTGSVVTVTPASGEYLDGQTSQTITPKYTGVVITSDGGIDWYAF